MTHRTYKPFIILGNARTGSSMLVQALNSHPQIVCFRELFNGTHDFVDFSVDGYDNFSGRDRARRAEDPIAFLQERIFRDWPPDVSAVGFKLLHVQAWDFAELLEHLRRDVDLYVLHLQRRNVLRTLTSLKLANQSDIWLEDRQSRPKLTRANMMRALRYPPAIVRSARRWVKRSNLPMQHRGARVAISPSELFEFLVAIRMRTDYYDAAFADHPSMAIFYEDLVERREETLEAAQAFLGVEPRELSTTLQRQNPEPLRDLIENYDELYEAFRDNPDADFFDD